MNGMSAIGTVIRRIAYPGLAAAGIEPKLCLAVGVESLSATVRSLGKNSIGIERRAQSCVSAAVVASLKSTEAGSRRCQGANENEERGELEKHFSGVIF
jgi:hypothetical protein